MVVICKLAAVMPDIDGLHPPPSTTADDPEEKEKKAKEEGEE